MIQFISRFLPVIALLAVSLAANPPSYPYAPVHVPCTSEVKVRPASQGLSEAERNWREVRLGHVVDSLHTYLPRADIPGLDLKQYLGRLNSTNAPVVGLAISGGGTQSGLGGLGLWQAFDERYPPAIAAGTGGLTQCLTYLSGLSGGGFLSVSSLASSNFSSIKKLREDINFTTNYLVGPTGNATEYYDSIFENVYAKFASGFPVSVTDAFGQFFRQYLPESWGYKDYSDIATTQNHSFSLGLGPMPILALSEVVSKTSPMIDNIMYPGLNSSNLTSYELTPFEFGSWAGGRCQAFAPTRDLGTVMNKGEPVNKSRCVRGFDKITFAQGTTANAFNFWLIDAFFNTPLFAKRDDISAGVIERDTKNTTISIPPVQQKNPQVQLVEEIAQTFNQTFNESLWARYPNPFLNYNEKMTGIDELLLVDGSETGETIPLRPLIVPERKLDFIIAFDASLDGDNGWVNGTNFLDASITAEQLGIPFPTVPDAATMVNLGITKYPTFFGCTASPDTPLVLYIPNAPWSSYSNFSYTQSSFTDNQLDLVFSNALDMVTYGQSNHSSGSNNSFSTCIACALIKKSLHRLDMPIPSACNTCFARHCWNGTRAETPSSPTYDPRLILEPEGLTFEEWNRTVWWAVK